MPDYTASQILAQCDACAREFTFPMLDNGYVYLACTRLHAYRDENRWAVIIEVLGANYRGGGASNSLYRFGNCIGDGPGLIGQDSFPTPLTDADTGEAIDRFECWNVTPFTGIVGIRGVAVSFDVRSITLAARGIPLAEPEYGPTCPDLLRSLIPEHRDQLLATETELRRRIPEDLPLLLRLDEWHHPDLIVGALPSGSETFQSIAEALVAGDPERYQPILPPNTHWSHWPFGGTL